jgi:hypothetical protein
MASALSNGLTLTGPVLEARTTKGGKWVRLVIASTGRLNHLVMARVGALPVARGDVVTIPVRASVDTNSEGRPTRNIVFFHDVPGEDQAAPDADA